MTLLLTLLTSFAIAGTMMGGAVQGTLFAPGGTPVTSSNVNFKVQVLDKNGTCVMYEETHLGVDLSQTNGDFSFDLGSGTSRSNFVSNTSSLDVNVYRNDVTPLVVTGCSPLTVAADDERTLRVQFDVGSGLVALSPDLKVQGSVYAAVAATVQGKSAADLLQVKYDGASNLLSQNNLNNIFSGTNYPALTALLAGTSTQYLPTGGTAPVNINGNRLINVAAPGTSPLDGVNKGYADTFVAGRAIDTSAIGAGIGGGSTIVWDSATNKWVAGVATSTPSGAAGGDLTGTYPNPTIKPDAITSAKINSTGVAVNRLLITDATTGANVTYATCLQNEVLKWTATGWACGTVASLAPVTTVAGKTGAVTLNAADIAGLGTVVTKDHGSAAGEVPLLGTGGRLPASMLPSDVLFNGGNAFVANVGIGTTTPQAGLDVATTGTLASALIVPRDTTSNRPSSPVNGMIRYNASTARFEAYESGAWTNMIGATSTSFPLRGPADSAAAPNYSWASDPTTGMYRVAANALGFSANSSLVAQIDANGVASWYSGSAASPSLRIGSNSTGFYVPSANQLGLATAGTARLVVTEDGKVGIGTTGPYSTLHVQATADDARLTLAANSAYNKTLQLTNTNNTRSWTIAQTATSDKLLISNSSGSQSAFTFEGLLGIGTITPQAGLDIATVGTGGSAILVPRDTTANRPSVAVNGMIRYNSSTNAFEGYSNGAWGNLAASGTASAQWSYGTSGQIYYNGGYVGVGTTNPTAALDVASEARVSSAGPAYLTLYGTQGQILSNAGGMKLISSGNNATSFETNGAERMRISSVGNVGIGTTNPAYALDVNGGGRFASGLYGTNAYFNNFRASNGSAFTPSYSFNLDGSAGMFDDGIGGVGIATSGIARLNIGSSGNVGIGTSSPSKLLEVYNTTASTPLNIVRANNATSPATTSYVPNGISATQPIWQTGISAGSNSFTVLSSDGTTPLGRLVIDPNGQVGIGTGTPQAGLDVATTGTSGSAILVPRDTTANRPATAVNGMIRYSTSSNKFEAYENGGWTNMIAAGSGVPGGSNNTLQYNNGGVFGGASFVTVNTGSKILNVGDIAGASVAITNSGGTASWSGLQVMESNLADGNAVSMTLGKSSTTNNASVIAYVPDATAANSSLQFSAFGHSVPTLTVTNGTGLGAGYVGVGTATPSAPLHVASSTLAQLNFEKTGGSANTSTIYNDGDFHIEGNNRKVWINGNTDAMTVLNVGGGYVGINTSSPNDMLELATNADGQGVLLRSSGADFASLRRSGLAGALNLMDNGTTRLRLNGGFGQASYINSGYLGIGTATPQAGLDVATTGTLASAIIVPRDTTTNRPATAINGMIRYNTTANAFEGYQNGGWTNLVAGSGTAASLFGDGSAGAPSIAFANQTGTGFYRFGNAIGVTTLGTASYAFGPGVISSLFTAGASVGMTGSTVGGPAYAFAGDTATGMHTPGTGSLALVTLGTARLSINALGNIGLGTNTPTGRLSLEMPEASGAREVFQTFAMSGDANTKAGYANSTFANGLFAPMFYAYRSGTADKYVQSVWGLTDAAGDTAQSENALVNIAGLVSDNAADPINGNLVNPTNRNILAVSSWNGPMLVVGPTGNLGIGTIAPKAALDVATTGTSSAVLVPRDTQANRPPVPVNGMIRYNTTANAFEGYANGAWGNLAASGTSSAQWTYGTSGQIYYNSGNVGIGMTNPTVPLDVTGNARVSGYLTTSRLYSPEIYVGTTASLNLTIDSTTSATKGNIAIAPAGGNVGIGTASPTSRLHVNNTTTLTSGGAANNSVYSALTTAPGTTSTASSRAVYGYNFWNGGSNSPGANVIGMSGASENGGAIGVGTLTGLDGSAGNTSSGTSSSAIGVSGYVNNTGTGTISSASGGMFYVNRPSGTITNAYGVYVGTIEGTNKYSLYAYDATAPSYFAGKVGIATSTPQAALDIAGTGTGASALIVPRDTQTNRPSVPVNGMLRYNTSTAAFEGYANGVWGGLGNAGSNVWSNGTSGQIYYNSGNVGVGTTNPTAKFSVGGAATDNAYFFNDNASVGSGTNGQSLYVYRKDSVNGDSYLRFWNDQYRQSHIETSGNGNLFFDAQAIYMMLPSPYTYVPASTGLYIPDMGGPLLGTGANSDGAAGGIILRTGNSAFNGQHGYISVLSNTGGYTPSMIFGVQTGATAYSERMRVNAQGNLGLGTSTPQAGLDIATAGTGGSAIIVPRDTQTNRPSVPVNGMIRYNTSTAAFEGYANGAWGGLASGGSNLWTNGTSGQIYYNGGNVGIGTNAPSGELTVEKAQNAKTLFVAKNSTAGTGAGAGFEFHTDSGRVGAVWSASSSHSLAHYRNRLLIDTDSTNSTGVNIVAAGTSSDVRIYTGGYTTGAERMRIAADGSVGIGIAAPWTDFMLYRNNATAIASIVSDNTSTTAARYPIVSVKNFGGTGTATLGTPAFELVNLRGNSTTSQVMQSGDALGALTFNGAINGATGYNAGAEIRAYAAETYSGSASGGALAFSTTGTGSQTLTERVRIDALGRVGIGNNNPQAPLDVTGAIDSSAKAYVTLTDGATVTWTVKGLVNNATVTLGGNRALSFSGLQNGMSGTLIVIQDGTGSRTLTLPSQCTNKVVSGGGGVVALSTANGAIDILTFTYDGTNCYWTYEKNYN